MRVYRKSKRPTHDRGPPKPHRFGEEEEVDLITRRPIGNNNRSSRLVRTFRTAVARRFVLV